MTQSDVTLTTVAAWGASEGISRQAAHTAVRRCGIPLQDGKVDPGVASALYRQRTRPRARTKAPPATAAPELAADGTTYQEARRRQAVADATTAEINLAVLRKQAMWVDDAVRLWQNIAANVKSALQNMPSRVAPLVAAETSASAVQILLKTEVNRILTDLANGVAAAETTVGATHDNP